MAPIMQAGSEGREETQGEPEFDMNEKCSNEKNRFPHCVHSPLFFFISSSACTSQHRRLSEASISPPGSSIGSPSRVICVSSLQSFEAFSHFQLPLNVPQKHNGYTRNTSTTHSLQWLITHLRGCSLPWPVHFVCCHGVAGCQKKVIKRVL